jgi:N-acetylglucosamine-6-phosphate deacetylase
MDDLEARKVLKVFGAQVTEFMGRRRQLTEQAAGAIMDHNREALTGLLATLMTETSELHRRWLEVTNLVLQEEREAYSEMARLLERAGQSERPSVSDA